jgi:hypothetical protein
MPIRKQKSIGYHTIGLFATGRRALGVSPTVKVGNDDPGPHSIIAWSPGGAISEYEA